MVLRGTIQNLQEEHTEEERRSIAAAIALGIVIVLLIGWTIVFFRKVDRSSAERSSPLSATTTQASP